MFVKATALVVHELNLELCGQVLAEDQFEIDGWHSATKEQTSESKSSERVNTTRQFKR